MSLIIIGNVMTTVLMTATVIVLRFIYERTIMHPLDGLEHPSSGYPSLGEGDHHFDRFKGGRGRSITLPARPGGGPARWRQ
jgi:hypothetical protein